MRVLLIGSNGQLGNDFRKLFDKKILNIQQQIIKN